eukprot:gene20414-22427_t
MANNENVNCLMEMGFSRERAEQASRETAGQDFQAAVEWMIEHEEDSGGLDEAKFAGETGEASGASASAVQTEPSTETNTETTDDVTAMQAQSLVCEECGKQLRSELDAQVHATRTGHQKFAESSAEIKPLTDEEKKEQINLLQQKIAERRKEREEMEKEEAKKREKIRRKTGKELTEAKHRVELAEMKKIADERKREKQEERLLRQKLRQRIAQDRANMKASSQPSAAVPPQQPIKTETKPQEAKEYDSCRIQFRFPNGSTSTCTFKPNDMLSTVYEHAAENGSYDAILDSMYWYYSKDQTDGKSPSRADGIDYETEVTGTACLFLAGKVEETPKKCKDLLRMCRTFLSESQFESFGENPREEVMMLERILLQTIKFDLQVDHPYQYLIQYGKDLKGDKERINELVQKAWIFINDSLSTCICLHYQPAVVSLAMLHLAAKLSKQSMQNFTPVPRQDWWRHFSPETEQSTLDDICNEMMDLYEPSRRKSKSREGSVTDSPATTSSNSPQVTGSPPIKKKRNQSSSNPDLIKVKDSPRMKQPKIENVSPPVPSKIPPTSTQIPQQQPPPPVTVQTTLVTYPPQQAYSFMVSPMKEGQVSNATAPQKPNPPVIMQNPQTMPNMYSQALPLPPPIPPPMPSQTQVIPGSIQGIPPHHQGIPPPSQGMPPAGQGMPLHNQGIALTSQGIPQHGISSQEQQPPQPQYAYSITQQHVHSYPPPQMPPNAPPQWQGQPPGMGPGWMK